MSKTISGDKQLYLRKIKPYQSTIDFMLKKEQKALESIDQNGFDASIRRMKLAEDMIYLASNYITINGVSQSMLKSRNEEALNEGRRTLGKALSYLEQVVSNYLDAAYSEYEEKLEEIVSIEPRDRYILACKLGLCIGLLKDAYGDNFKWIWSFVELEGRFAIVTKNLLNLKKVVANTDPRSPDYEPTVRHLLLVKRLLNQSANRYREKYELSTKNIDDFKIGLNFLHALRRVNTLLGDRSDVEIVKKKLDAWNLKLEADIKKIKESIAE